VPGQLPWNVRPSNGQAPWCYQDWLLRTPGFYTPADRAAGETNPHGRAQNLVYVLAKAERSGSTFSVKDAAGVATRHRVRLGAMPPGGRPWREEPASYYGGVDGHTQFLGFRR
jgi:hypothetical protein